LREFLENRLENFGFMMIGPLTNRRLEHWNRREILSLGAVAAAGLSASSCTPPKTKITRKTVGLGERAEAGPFVFVALEANWSMQLGSAPNGRTAKNQFMIVRISITNQGGTSAGCPMLALVDESDNRYPEVDDAKEQENWLGMIRVLTPAETLFGWIVFDVSPSSYVLRLSDGNVENEHVAFVDIPLRLS
jgi:hypothetical protein